MNEPRKEPCDALMVAMLNDGLIALPQDMEIITENDQVFLREVRHVEFIGPDEIP